MTLPAPVETAISQTHVKAVHLVELFFADGTARLARDDGDIYLPDGTVWTGLGGLISISAVEQPSNEGAPSVTLTLSGVDEQMLRMAIRSETLAVNRTANVYLAIFDADTGAYIDRVSSFAGRIDAEISYATSPEGASGFSIGRRHTITAKIENLFAANRARQRDMNYSHRDQRHYYPTDLGLEHLVAAEEQTAEWPFEVVA